MRHKFLPLPIPTGKKSVIETCACGQESLRYTSGQRQYRGQMKECDRNTSLDKQPGFLTASLNREKVQRGRTLIDQFEAGELGECGPGIPEEEIGQRDPCIASISLLDQRDLEKKHGNLSEPVPCGIHDITRLVGRMYREPLQGYHKPLTNQEARQKEALVLINLAYEKLVSLAGLNDKTTQQLGRYLYSEGYEELRKYYDQKAVQ